MTGPVRLDRAGAVATLTLNRPDAANAIDLALARALAEAAMACEADATIRCVVLTGAGRMFCGGGDTTAFAAAADRLPLLLRQLTTDLHAAIAVLARMPKPLITAINGAAAGAGMGLAMLGDLALAAASAKFVPAYAAIGLSPDAATSFLLPRLVGLRRAQEILLTNQRLSAEQAAALGIVTRVVADADLAAAAAELAAQLAAGPTAALGRARMLLLDSFGNTLETQLDIEARAMVASGRK